MSKGKDFLELLGISKLSLENLSWANTVYTQVRHSSGEAKNPGSFLADSFIFSSFC